MHMDESYNIERGECPESYIQGSTAMGHEVPFPGSLEWDDRKAEFPPNEHTHAVIPGLYAIAALVD